MFLMHYRGLFLYFEMFSKCEKPFNKLWVWFFPPIREVRKSGTSNPSFHCLSENSNLSVGKGGSWRECPTYLFHELPNTGSQSSQELKTQESPSDRKSETGERLEAPHLKPADKRDAVLTGVIVIIRRELIPLDRVIKKVKKGTLWLMLSWNSTLNWQVVSTTWRAAQTCRTWELIFVFTEVPSQCHMHVRALVSTCRCAHAHT